MKKLCLFAIAYLLTFSVFSQSEKGYVYLKNGTILKGKFLYSDDLNKLKVESAGNIWVFGANEIDSVSSLRAHRLKEVKQKDSESRFLYHLEIGILAGNSENSQSAPFSFTSSVNYAVTPNFSAGAGFGVEFLKESYLPAFLNLKYQLRNSFSTPYFFVKAGYQIPLEESRTVYYDIYPAWSSVAPGPGEYGQESLESKGGIMLNPGMGYQRMFSANFGMSFGFGYQFHRLHYKGDKDYGLDIDYNRLTIKLGIVFN